MEIVRKKVSELRPPEVNVRRHTEKQMQEYVRSIRMFGQTKPILCDEAGEIIVGNGLFEALKRTGAEEADCVVMAGLTEAKKRKLMLADNRVYELGITDVDAFDEIIKGLGDDLDVPGWDEEMLAMLNASVQQINDEIGSYGAYTKEEVDGLDRTRERKEYVPGSPNVTRGDIENGAPAVTYAGPAEQPSEDGMSQAEPRRYVVCPKCGEKICL